MASVTITDVARRAGVSMKTVSRVMNAEPHVRDEVRQTVLRVARELHYRPKVSARSLAGARSYQLGFLLHQVSPYAIYAQLGALRACRAFGYHLVVESIDLAALDLTADMEALVNGLSVDGLILLPPVCDNKIVLKTLDAAAIPYVRISPATVHERSPRIDPGDAAAACAMTEHLLGLGHRRIALIQGPRNHAASARRLEGFAQALAAQGLRPAVELVQEGLFTFESGRDAVASLLALKHPPTAIFASNDLMAFGVMAKAHELGLRIPGDLSVAGFDDIATASMVWPPLTTMRQPMADMAAAAAESLIATAGKGGAEPLEGGRSFSCELVIRGSTAPPP